MFMLPRDQLSVKEGRVDMTGLDDRVPYLRQGITILTIGRMLYNFHRFANLSFEIMRTHGNNGRVIEENLMVFGADDPQQQSFLKTCSDIPLVSRESR